MSIPTSPPPASPPPTDFDRATHAISLTLLIAAPILLALPPRKLDFYTYTLAGAWAISVNHLTTQRTGRSIPAYLTPRWAMQELPSERARELQARLRAEREGKVLGARTVVGTEEWVVAGGEKRGNGGKTGDEARGVVGLAEKAWMANEGEGWKEWRLREEQEALAEGKGYGDLIMEQIWEVWNWGKTGQEGEGLVGGKDGEDANSNE